MLMGKREPRKEVEVAQSQANPDSAEESVTERLAIYKKAARELASRNTGMRLE